MTAPWDKVGKQTLVCVSRTESVHVARIAPVKFDEATPEQAALFEQWRKIRGSDPTNALLTVAHAPEFLEPLHSLFALLTTDEREGRIGVRLRALISMRVPRLNQCRYCSTHQTVRRTTAGFSDEEIDALYGDPQSADCFTDQEKLVLRYVDEVTRDCEPALNTWAAMSQQFRSDQLVEITMLIGLWCMWNRIVDSFKVDLEDFNEQFLVDHARVVPPKVKQA